MFQTPIFARRFYTVICGIVETMQDKETCPKCGSPLGDIVETATGKKLRRCSTGSWNKETKKNEGCDYVKWLTQEPQTLDEKCPKCGQPLMLQFTRFGKKMKKCSAGGWDKEAKKATGCDYVEWINGSTEKLDEDCPECGEKLVLFTTNNGKRMKKCSTSGWDREAKKATGCTYIQWIKGNFSSANNGEEFLPPEDLAF
jgi:ssDNA-binding Zn-finger/Zn-ribbon topoisomerase 1